MKTETDESKYFVAPHRLVEIDFLQGKERERRE